MFASKAFPCTAVLALFAQEGLWCDVASGGELHLALNAGFAPERHRAARQRQVGGRAAHGAGARRRADRDRQLRRDRAPAAAAWRAARVGCGRRQPVLVRVTPDVRGETHEKISTGQADSKFGFAIAQRRARRSRACSRSTGCRCRACTRTSARSCSSSSRFAREVAELAQLGDFPVWDLGGGLGVRYTADQPPPPAIEEYVRRARARGRTRTRWTAPGRRLLIEPGRALCANAGVTLYTVESVKQNVSRWVAVDGGMSDNLRPMLYGARYEAHVADRFGGDDALRAGRQALRVRRRDRARGAARRPAPGRRDRHAGDRRLRLCDGQQLQRRAAPAGDLLPRRRRARGRQARDASTI